MKILVTLEIDVDFDTDGVKPEFDIEAIKDAVEGCVMNDEMPELLVADITDASSWSVEGLSVGIKKIEVEV